MMLRNLLMGPVPAAVSIWPKIIGWWERDESSGTTMIDSHTNSLDGTYSGITLNQTALAANLGKSVTFPVGDNYSDVPDNALLKPTGNLSAMVWIKRNGSQILFPKWLWKPSSNNVGGFANYMLSYVDSTQKASWRVSIAGVNYSAVSSTSIADSTSYFVVGTRLSTDLKLYINSVLDANITIPSGATETSTQSLRWGYLSQTTHDPWVGSQDQTAVFNEALTQTEIEYLYNGGAGVSYATMKADSGH